MVKVVGTYGYAAPEYVETGHLTAMSDIWSFGVVLYEILTGRRSLERNRPRREQNLLDWVKQFPAESRKFSMIMDPRLEDQYPLSAARKIAQLADKCLCKNAKERPKMSQVLESLKQAVQVSEEGSSSEKCSPEFSGADQIESDEKTDQMGTAESMKRRMAHLARLSENANAVGKRKFMIMQRTKVP